MNLSVQLLSEHARVPLKGSKNAAGFDLFSAYDYEIPSHGRLLCATDIAVAIPPRHYGRVGNSQSNHKLLVQDWPSRISSM